MDWFPSRGPRRGMSSEAESRFSSTSWPQAPRGGTQSGKTCSASRGLFGDPGGALQPSESSKEKQQEASEEEEKKTRLALPPGRVPSE